MNGSGVGWRFVEIYIFFLSRLETKRQKNYPDPTIVVIIFFCDFCPRHENYWILVNFGSGFDNSTFPKSWEYVAFLICCDIFEFYQFFFFHFEKYKNWGHSKYCKNDGLSASRGRRSLTFGTRAFVQRVPRKVTRENAKNETKSELYTSSKKKKKNKKKKKKKQITRSLVLWHNMFTNRL